jgi:hypothetical protein
MINEKFGRLTVIEQVENIRKLRAYRCVCECGNQKVATGASLRRGDTKSCGCLQNENRKANSKKASEASAKKNRQNLIGETFGRLTVIERAPSKNRATMYQCKCECGTIKEVAHGNLKKGCILSCGCLKAERVRDQFTKHGCSAGCSDPTISEDAKRTYRIWKAIKYRCNNSDAKPYHYYGGRGISYDPRWESFDGFVADMGYAPPDRSIDRIDVNGNYYKENCRWATWYEQRMNQRRMQS